jgi:hypothetical protein
MSRERWIRLKKRRQRSWKKTRKMQCQKKIKTHGKIMLEAGRCKRLKNGIFLQQVC